MLPRITGSTLFTDTSHYCFAFVLELNDKTPTNLTNQGKCLTDKDL